MLSIVTDSTSNRRVPVDWVREELSIILRILDDAEKSESEVWLLTARLSGLQARASRAEEWSAWYRQTTTRIAEVRRSLATAPEPPAEAPVPSVMTYQPRGGYLERVRLPLFSGSVEDYGEFKTQFQELCKGEHYSGVIELAQLRQKLPKEAVALLTGLATPDVAWKRLDETYGNVDMQVLAALKRLRAFKPGKSSPSERVVEVASAVQRCVTVLAALDRSDSLLLRSRDHRGSRQPPAPGLATAVVSPEGGQERDAGREGKKPFDLAGGGACRRRGHPFGFSGSPRQDDAKPASSSSTSSYKQRYGPIRVRRLAFHTARIERRRRKHQFIDGRRPDR